VAVFVDKSAKDVDSFDSQNLGARRRRLTVGGRHAEVEGAVWSGGVVVPDVGHQDSLEMAPVPDQHPVQALVRTGRWIHCCGALIGVAGSDGTAVGLRHPTGIVQALGDGGVDDQAAVAATGIRMADVPVRRGGEDWEGFPVVSPVRSPPCPFRRRDPQIALRWKYESIHKRRAEQ